MNFSRFSKKLHPNLSGISSQGHFVGALFSAAGSEFFPVHPSYGTDDNQRKLFSGARVFNNKMKDSFPKPLGIENLNAFFQTRIGEASLPKIISNFGIPNENVQNKNLFIAALCTQFQLIVSDVTNDVDDIVMSEYIRLLSESKNDTESIFPLYPGDDILLVSEHSIQSHTAAFYEIFDHTWSIKNIGTVTWEGRRLECKNQATTKIKTLNTRIDIPKTKPGVTASLSVQIDARGFEGAHESIWEIKDANGRCCFPDKSKALKVVVTVINEHKTPLEG